MDNTLPYFLRNLEFPGVLVAEEKHCTRYLRAGNLQELEASALKLLKERFDEGYWYYEPKKEPTAPAISKEAAEKLPEGNVKKLALQEIRQYERALAENADARDFWTQLKKALDEKDGKLAYKLLHARRDYEYENVEFETLE